VAEKRDSIKHGIGLIGCGRISASHLEGYAALGDRAKVIAVCDQVLGAAEERAQTFGIPHAYDSLDRIIEDPEIDVVSVATPPDVRLQVVRPLLEAGKHVLVEKPFADSLAEAEIMVAVASQLGVLIAVNQNYRFLPESVFLKSALADGRLGRPIFMAQNHSAWRDGLEGWRSSTERLAVAVMGVHWLDRFRWLLGQEAHSIFCASMFSGLLDSEGEDLATLIVQFPNGCVASLTEQWCSHARGAANHFQLDCTEGSIIVSNESLRVYDSSGSVIEGQEASMDIRPTFEKSMAELLDAIDEDREPSHSGLENLGTMALLDGAYLSTEQGSRVEIGVE